MMKRFFPIVLSAVILFSLSGCGKYSDIKEELDNVKIKNILDPDYSGSFQTIENAYDTIYELSLDVCQMYAESAEKTNSKEYIKEYGSNKKIISLCNDRRHELNEDIEALFTKHMNMILKSVKDCSNKPAYIKWAHQYILNFYDAYDEYLASGRNDDQAKVNMLLQFYQQDNDLSRHFLTENKYEICDAAVNVIVENSNAKEEFRWYINQNNQIIDALNEFYEKLPSKYADDITKATSKLVTNLLNSLENLTAKERESLEKQLDELNGNRSDGTIDLDPKASPSPSASTSPIPLTTFTPRPTPTIPVIPSATPARPTVSTAPVTIPTAVPTPNITAAPPVSTPEPTPVPTPVPTPEPTPEPTPVPTETPEPTPIPTPDLSIEPMV